MSNNHCNKKAKHIFNADLLLSEDGKFMVFIWFNLESLRFIKVCQISTPNVFETTESIIIRLSRFEGEKLINCFGCKIIHKTRIVQDVSVIHFILATLLIPIVIVPWSVGCQKADGWKFIEWCRNSKVSKKMNCLGKRELLASQLLW